MSGELACLDSCPLDQVDTNHEEIIMIYFTLYDLAACSQLCLVFAYSVVQFCNRLHIPTAGYCMANWLQKYKHKGTLSCLLHKKYMCQGPYIYWFICPSL